MKRQRAIFRTVIAPIVVTVAIVPTLAIAIWEVLQNHGAAAYSNVYGLSIQYTSVLILFVAVLLALALAYIARIVYFWRNRHDGAAKLRKIESLGSSVNSGRDE